MVAGIAAAAVVAAGAPAAPAAAEPPDRPWMNTALDPDQRAALLLAAMTLEEKIELMTGDQGEAPAAFYNGPIERLGIPELSMADAGVGIASRGWELPGTGDTATALPAGISLGASWDPELGNAFAEVVAEEAIATGHEMLLGPTADPVRTPFWGRIADSPGEDPYFISRFTTPFVKVVQDHEVIANLKHYAGYSQETNRGRAQNSIISERALHEVWTYPYKDAIDKADLGSVMCSFNKVNGAFACENDELLDRILRQQLGFTGFVITDFGAIHSTEPSIRAGTDMETGTAVFYDGALLAAVQAGRVPVSLVDRSVLRILRTMFAIGVFDRTYPLTALPVQEHGQVARDVQEEGITLLRNRGVLPLVPRRLDSVALIGADANITARLGGASHVKPTYQVPVLTGLGDRADDEGINFRYAQGNDPVGGFSMIETSDMTALPSSVLTPESGNGRGVTARYWNNREFQGPEAVTRTERQVAYDSGFVGGHFEALYASQVPAVPLSPAPGQAQSVVYTGFLTAPTTGTYRLGLTGWGDASLFVGDTLVVQNNGTQNRWSQASTIDLEGGRRYPIRVTYATRALVQLQPGTMLLQWAPPSDALEPALQEARQAARDADVAVVYLRTYESEERDRVSLKLPQNGDRLIRAVSEANPNTVVVIASGGPVTMPWRDRVGAVVQNWFGGQEEGNALARILFGDEDPSGHLPITFPETENALGPGAQNPWATYDNPDVVFSEDVNIGYRGYLAAGVRPAFPFGHGLSYTTFAFDRLRTQGLQADGADATAQVRVRVRNTGNRAGTEVVQVYLGPLPGVEAPERKLAGFAKVDVDRRGQTTVTIDIDRQQFSFWDEARDRWVTPRGRVPVYVGKSATEVELSGFIQVR
jgi:beta-glucosidase